MPGSMLGAGGNALSRFEAEGARLRGEGVERAWLKPPKERGGDIDHAGLAGERAAGLGSAGEVAVEEGGALAGAGGEEAGAAEGVVAVRTMASIGGCRRWVLGEGNAIATAPTSLPSDVNGAAAHALHDACVFEGATGEAARIRDSLGQCCPAHQGFRPGNRRLCSRKDGWRPIPRIPGLMSLRGKRAVWAL